MRFDFDWTYVSAGAPYVTISELGLAFNSPSSSLLGNPEEVVIGFDEKQMAIGVKNAESMEDVKPYKFFSRMRSGWVRIGCKDFVKYLSAISGISFSSSKRFVAKYDIEEQVLFIIVNEDEAKDDNKTE
uniref:Uncharacterized protein n=1 Tax=Eubacterium cellulosolvens (strain ATCC 43171 / JCM 9499 / 6) TaxID=633697 RepID=I5AT25_EUBC6|nr:hypothetical protein [[Eubacterium] cellulosolvens]